MMARHVKVKSFLFGEKVLPTLLPHLGGDHSDHHDHYHNDENGYDGDGHSNGHGDDGARSSN